MRGPRVQAGTHLVQLPQRAQVGQRLQVPRLSSSGTQTSSSSSSASYLEGNQECDLTPGM